MSDSGLARRKQRLLDKFLAGEIDKQTYDHLLAQLSEFESSVPTPVEGVDSDRLSSGSFEVTESRTTSERSAYSAPVPLLDAGMELGGFQLQRRLRRGGMGEVWQAFDPTGERTVVIKVLPPELQRSADEMARVKQTFNRVHNLQHEHICPLYLLGHDARFGYFIVMKYLQGDTLSAYRKAIVQEHGAFLLSDVIRVLTPVAQALDYAHGRQIIHRDIKPQNIMLNADGSDVQLVDFGLAAEVRTSVMRISQVQMETCGTYPYMAPEQWRGEMQDARTDQYALAVMAYELLAGQLPFEAADPTILRMCVLNDPVPDSKSIPSAVRTVIERGMAKRRDDRFETCSRFVSALAAASKSGDEDIVILDEDHVSARPSKPVAPASQRTVRTSESKTAESRTAVTGSNRPPRTDKRVEEPAAKTTPPSKPSKPAVVSADRKTDQLDDVDILEDHDLTEVDDDRITASRKDRKRGSKPDRRNKTECDLDQVNAKAQRWILILGGCAALFVVGLIGFAAWAGMNSFFKPSTPDRSNGHEIANSTPDGGQNSGSNNAANSDKSKLNPVVPPENKTAQLRYGWEQAKPYVYTVKVELEPDPDVVVTMTGNSTYTLGQPIARKRNDPDSGQGTGTGFVVQAGGYLVTCQHVVEDASEIEVAIGGKKYPAKVIIEDVEHDLALIKIEANGLSTLPLANSDQVQVGEEVRAIGFPLSSILGDNIKATRGTISGVNQEDDRKVFQVDAGINPGNSGGPLVNERGEVIGVNFAKLREEMATNVGFAVPINDAATLLRGEGVAFTNGNGKGAKLDGPELVKRVSAATALITVTTGNGPANGLHHYELKCTGSLNSSVKSKSGKIDPQATLAMQRQHLRAAMNTTFTEPDIVETDALGRVHEITGGRSSLPGYMGPMSIMVLEQFPSGRRTNWSNRFAVTIVINESNDDNVPFPRFRPRFRPPGFPGFPGFNDNPQKTTRIPGKVRVAYTLQEAIGDLQKIKKEFDLEAREDGAADTRIKLTGSGVFTFNTRTGVPRSLEYAATLIENEQNKTSRLPIRLSYQISEDRPPNQNVAQAPPDPVNPPAAVEHPVPHEITQRFTKDEIDQCLTDLRGGHAGRSSIAAAKLLRAVPLDERRDEVLKSLEAMLADKDQFRRKQAVDAMGTWAKPETIPVLIRCLDESALLVKLAAIDALGRLKDQRAAEPLAKLLAEPGPRVQAAKALKLLGEKAESAVVGLLKHADPDVRREACRLLKDIGTSSSLTDLQTACSDEDRTVATLAKEAATAISNRK